MLILSYTTKQAWTYALNTESTRNWEANEDEWTVPVNVTATKVIKLGDQLVSVGGGARYNVAGPDTSPDWGLGVIITFLIVTGLFGTCPVYSLLGSNTRPLGEKVGVE